MNAPSHARGGGIHICTQGIREYLVGNLRGFGMMNAATFNSKLPGV